LHCKKQLWIQRDTVDEIGRNKGNLVDATYLFVQQLPIVIANRRLLVELQRLAQPILSLNSQFAALAIGILGTIIWQCKLLINFVSHYHSLYFLRFSLTGARASNAEFRVYVLGDIVFPFYFGPLRAINHLWMMGIGEDFEIFMKFWFKNLRQFALLVKHIHCWNWNGLLTLQKVYTGIYIMYIQYNTIE